MKVLLLWDRMGDYHRARWKALQQLLGNENVFGADLLFADNLYKWENTNNQQNYVCLSGNDVQQKSVYGQLKRFIQFVKKNDINTFCIPGYGRLIYVLILLWSWIHSKKIIMFAESWYPNKIKVFDRVKGLFVRVTTNFVFVSGERAKQHFIQNLNYDAKSILTGYSVVDNEHFSKTDNLIPSSQLIKSPFFNNPSKTLLCIARFAPEKNLEILIDAFAKSNLLKVGYGLMIIGGGPLKDQLVKQIEILNMQNHIFLHEWVSYKELPGFYQQASCFVLPSNFEPWGLVVNEAMSAGLPVIVSDAVGAVPELCKETNSWIFESENEAQLINVLNILGEISEEKLSQMGQSSQEIIIDYTCEIWAKKIAEA